MQVDLLIGDVSKAVAKMVAGILSAQEHIIPDNIARVMNVVSKLSPKLLTAMNVSLSKKFNLKK
jgi:hypothetical protein